MRTADGCGFIGRLSCLGFGPVDAGDAVDEGRLTGTVRRSVTSFVPQVWKVIKTGNTEAISARMCIVTVIGFALWTAFGLLRREWPIILTNAACFYMAGFILIRSSAPPVTDDFVAHGRTILWER